MPATGTDLSSTPRGGGSAADAVRGRDGGGLSSQDPLHHAARGPPPPEGEEQEPLHLLHLLTWLSPAFPVGAFGWSHGLERAIADGVVHDAETLADWIALLLTHGSAWNDAVLFNAALCGGPDDWPDLADLAEALAVSRERHAETMTQGGAFLQALAAWPDARPGLVRAPYPIAVAAACQLAGIAARPALAAWLHGFAAAQVSVALRAMPLGQSDGVAVLARLQPLILQIAARAAASSLDDLGSAALAADVAALRHETQTVRLFLS
jgi:urease accessory protein